MESSNVPNILNYNAPISANNKKILQSYPIKWVDDFLIMTARIAHGDLDKRIKILDIWERLDLKAVQGNYQNVVIKNIIDILVSNSLIKRINTEEISIKYKIVDVAVKLTNESYENFGLISWNELEKRLKNYISIIYNETEIKKEPIPISVLANKFQGYPNINVIEQMARFYNDKGLIHFNERQNLIFKTDKGLQFSN